VDSVFNRRVKAGAKVLRPPEDQFYGDRSASIEDPFGHIWRMASHVKDVSMDEIKKAAEEMAKK
jgi:PhnB protein